MNTTGKLRLAGAFSLAVFAAVWWFQWPNRSGAQGIPVLLGPGVNSEAAPPPPPQLAWAEQSAAAERSGRVAVQAETVGAPNFVVANERVGQGAGFDIRAFRRETVARLFERFVACKEGSDDEWNAGYQLMLVSMYAHQDYLGIYNQGGGNGFRASANSHDYLSYSDNREYRWGRSDYPVLAEMLESRAEVMPDSSPGVPRGVLTRKLTEVQRRAIVDLSVQASAELADKR